MIEDMKNMMVDLNGKINEVDEKLENVTTNLKVMSHNNNNNKTNNSKQQVSFFGGFLSNPFFVSKFRF